MIDQGASRRLAAIRHIALRLKSQSLEFSDGEALADMTLELLDTVVARDATLADLRRQLDEFTTLKGVMPSDLTTTDEHVDDLQSLRNNLPRNAGATARLSAASGVTHPSDNTSRIHELERQLAAHAPIQTVHGGNVGASGHDLGVPFYLLKGQCKPEYDQGQFVVVSYDDLYNLGLLRAAASAQEAPRKVVEEDDPALETACDILDASVCECGHTDGEHAGPRRKVFAPLEGACHAEGGECDCEQFDPVAFSVTRCTEEAPQDAHVQRLGLRRESANDDARPDASPTSATSPSEATTTIHPSDRIATLAAQVRTLTDALAEEKGLHQLSGEAHMEVRAICAEVGEHAAFVDDAVRAVVERLKAAEATLASTRMQIQPALVAKWRERARIGRQYQLGEAQWVAALSARVYAECADELGASVTASDLAALGTPRSEKEKC